MNRNRVFLLLAAIFVSASIFSAHAADKLPNDIEWLTNDSEPVFASPKAVKGGLFKVAIMSFPPTFRVVGPDANSSFRSAILDNQLQLLGIHPNTLNTIPQLATHWAYGKDKKTVYFKINPKAKWSDGVPVTADDFAYTLEFMRSKHIVAPWYNDYYSREIDKVIIYDRHTIAIVAGLPKPDLHLRVALPPTPKHFYKGLGKDFIQKYNWKIAPNTGAYQMSDFKKGKYIKFKRKKDWWAKDLKYFKNRFNVDTVKFEVIRETNIAWEHFKKGKFDEFGLTRPKFWHEKSNIPIFQKGYCNKIQFFNDTQRSASGFFLNGAKEIFKDKNVRYAFAHAMNMEKVLSKVLRNDYYRLEQMFMGYNEYTLDTIRARRFDIKKTAQYMETAGFKRGSDGIWVRGKLRFSVEVLYSKDVLTRRYVVLKEEAKKAGVELKLKLIDSTSKYRQVQEKNHEVASLAFSTSLRPRFWEHFHSINANKPQTNNITNTADPEMDKLISTYRNSIDVNERIELSKKLQAKVHEIASFVPTVMVPYVRHGYWRWLKLPDTHGTKNTNNLGVSPMNGNGLFKPFEPSTGGLFWIDKAVKKETLAAKKKGKTFKPVTIIDTTYKMESLK